MVCNFTAHCNSFSKKAVWTLMLLQIISINKTIFSNIEKKIVWISQSEDKEKLVIFISSKLEREKLWF